jgi:hypothetical protein
VLDGRGEMFRKVCEIISRYRKGVNVDVNVVNVKFVKSNSR